MPALLEQSRVRGRVPWAWYIAGGLVLALIAGSALGNKSEAAAALVNFFVAVILVLAMAATGLLAFTAARRQREEFQRVQAAEELVQLRRWQEAATLVRAILSQPMRSEQARFQTLLYLAALLARYHQFTGAITVQEYILENVLMDPASVFGLKLGRAMALLREDRLFDADRAISELRRAQVAIPEVLNTHGTGGSGGLALVEIYRDVKTGHPAEAIDLFNEKLPALREQLGHRLGDAYALVARAYDFMDRPDEAKAAYAKATLLAPPAELQRRYPEIAAVAKKYAPTPAPGGMRQ